MAKLLTYDGQVIDPTAYIYMATPRDFGCKKCHFWSQTQGVNEFSDPKKVRPNLGALFF